MGFTPRDIIDQELMKEVSHRIAWTNKLVYVKGDASDAQLVRCLLLLADQLAADSGSEERVLHMLGKLYVSWAYPNPAEPGMSYFLVKGTVVLGTRRQTQSQSGELKLRISAKLAVEGIIDCVGKDFKRAVPTFRFQTHTTSPRPSASGTITSIPPRPKEKKRALAASNSDVPRSRPHTVGSSNQRPPDVNSVDLQKFYFASAPDGVSRLVWREYQDAEGEVHSTLPHGRTGWYPVFAPLAPCAQYTSIIDGVTVKAMEVQIDWTQQVVLRLL